MAFFVGPVDDKGIVDEALGHDVGDRCRLSFGEIEPATPSFHFPPGLDLGTKRSDAATQHSGVIIVGNLRASELVVVVMVLTTCVLAPRSQDW